MNGTHIDVERLTLLNTYVTLILASTTSPSPGSQLSDRLNRLGNLLGLPRVEAYEKVSCILERVFDELDKLLAPGQAALLSSDER